MKVILIKDVARLGRKSALIEVPDGHALNFLIPKGFAVIATSERMKRHTEETKKQDGHRAQNDKSFEDTIAKLQTEKIVYEAEANEKGNLFKGINSGDIARTLSSFGGSIEAPDIVLQHPIKELGIHEIQITRGKVKGSFRLEVIGIHKKK
jgi:large subunit ribosomal protein L9